MRPQCVDWISKAIATTQVSSSVFLDAVYYLDLLQVLEPALTGFEACSYSLILSLKQSCVAQLDLADFAGRFQSLLLKGDSFDEIVEKSLFIASVHRIDHSITEKIITIANDCFSQGVLTQFQSTSLIQNAVKLGCHVALVDHIHHDSLAFALALSMVAFEKFQISTDFLMSDYSSELDLVDFVHLFRQVSDYSCLFEEEAPPVTPKKSDGSPQSLHKYLSRS
ncbi:hypothetical protein P9112_001784 [Eukaryota sp. TZLM1-RC]